MSGESSTGYNKYVFPVSPLSFDSGESIGISMPGEASTQIAIQLLQTFIQ